MPRRISDALNVERDTLKAEGALDGFTDIDAQFHIDPHLLKSIQIPEFSSSYNRLEKHFKDIIHLLEASQRIGDRFFRQAALYLTFHEIHEIKLGYSVGSSFGKGIGPGLAWRIASTAFEIVKAGVKDPVIFELVGLFEEDIGADRISDMAVQIILPDILNYSQRVARNLSAETFIYRYKGINYRLPYDEEENKVFTLLPYSILRNLPVALDWEDIDIVASYNQSLRDEVNQIIGATWKEAHTKHKKDDLKRAILEYPELLNDLIRQYKGKKNKQYDFIKDKAGELIWADIAKNYSDRYPLTLDLKLDSPPSVLQTVVTICEHFKKLVENNGLNRLLYDDSKKLRHERYAQLLFYGIADSYCEANNIDISREPNAGNGPVDFKFSTGFTTRINVEVKYSSNTHLVKGYTTQLSLYNKSENAYTSIYLIIRTTESEKAVKSILSLNSKNKGKRLRVPRIIVIDSRIKSSASKR